GDVYWGPPRRAAPTNPRPGRGRPPWRPAHPLHHPETRSGTRSDHRRSCAKRKTLYILKPPPKWGKTRTVTQGHTATTPALRGLPAPEGSEFASRESALYCLSEP